VRKYNFLLFSTNIFLFSLLKTSTFILVRLFFLFIFVSQNDMK